MNVIVNGIKRCSISQRLIAGNGMILLVWGLFAIVLNWDETHWKISFTPLLRISTWALFSISVGCSLAMSRWLINLSLSPLLHLSETMNRIAEGAYHLRSELQSAGRSPINTCVRSLNRMLDVLETE